MLADLEIEKQLIVLKARQLGLSWLVLAYALWLGVFKPNSTVLIFSMRDVEAMDLLRNRIAGMYDELPDFLRPGSSSRSNHLLELKNGSSFQAFATTAGRSYTASLVIVDEADFIPNLQRLITAVKPTIDAQGQLVMISTSFKDEPNSPFKAIFRKSRNGEGNYRNVFLDWQSRPDRDLTWYKNVAADYDQDDLYQEYPATIEQALMGRQASKRFPLQWVEYAYQKLDPIDIPELSDIPGLMLYETPVPDRKDERGRLVEGDRYVISVDPSEGDITSDPSPATIFNKDTWEEAGHLWGVFEVATLAAYVARIGVYFNNAVICPERNNHGHALILALQVAEYENIYENPHDRKPGWLSNVKWKATAIDKTAEVLREESLIIHTEAIKMELANLEAATLKAPAGDYDDRAMTIIIGIAALVWPTAQIDPRGGYYIPRRSTL